jgi:hypothetical protein
VVGLARPGPPRLAAGDACANEEQGEEAAAAAIKSAIDTVAVFKVGSRMVIFRHEKDADAIVV